ncbi:glycosyltransferase family 2 protein [Bradyrhizobium prioriisuperbiae]|uniref:glycosyltransferase family 2 protein n=1 Tax=Bradyrhizobium prioriisuperbiae TaxID=2854389 RepID=UPI0028EEE1C8|nr:glycosyltransferase [Bradyrhizobium prioritasuperba]
MSGVGAVDEEALIRASGLFDEHWYLEKYRDVAAAKCDPLQHYLAHGVIEGRNPNRFFDTNWYLMEYPEVEASGTNPLVHYVRHGVELSYDPHPHFSTSSYLQANPSIAASRINPLSHFLRQAPSTHQSSSPYQVFLAKMQREGERELSELLQHLQVMTFRPLFIIWIDGSRADGSAAAQSCANQIYPDHLVAYSAAEVLQLLAGSEPVSTYMIWMQPEDRLNDKALYACAAALNAQPDLDLIYFDEDVWDETGRHSPFHKPDWSPDYLESMNYIGNAACYRLSKAGDLLSDIENPYDFLLRFAERTPRILHVREVLLHRTTTSCEPISIEQIHADTRAISGRLHRTGRRGAVTASVTGHGCYDVLLQPRVKPLVSIIIPTAGRVVEIKNRKVDLIVQCIDTTLARSTYTNLEFVVIDNGDFDRERLGHVKAAPLKFATYDLPEVNIAKKLNIGASLASGEIFLILNDDVEPLAADWIERMLSHFEKPHVGVVGAKLLYPDKTIQHVGVVSNRGQPEHVRRGASREDKGYFFSTCGVRNYLAVTGAVAMTPAKLYRQVGGYSENLPIDYNDIDYCLKLFENGYYAVYEPKAELTHYESISIVKPPRPHDAAYFALRWAIIDRDPFYNEECLTIHPPTFDLSYNQRAI